MTSLLCLSVASPASLDPVWSLLGLGSAMDSRDRKGSSLESSSDDSLLSLLSSSPDCPAQAVGSLQVLERQAQRATSVAGPVTFAYRCRTVGSGQHVQ